MVLSVRSLHKVYGTRQAVAGLSFEVAPGEIFGLLGPNGAGKSTTVQMIAGLVAPSAGSIAIAGFDVVRDPKRARRRVGFVPQEIALYAALSGEDNLAFWGQMYGLSGQYLKKRIELVLELVGLAERRRDRVGAYSGGMQRRLNLAAGLLHEPELLLLDEPTVGVDPQSRNRIFEGIEQLNREGLTIIYTSHYLEEVERLCHRVAIIESGKLLALDSPSQLKATGTGLIELTLPVSIKSLEAQLLALGGVRSVVQNSNIATIEADHPQQVLAAVLDLITRSHLPVENVRLVEPSLETVFLRLTGRGLRDGETPP